MNKEKLKKKKRGRKNRSSYGVVDFNIVLFDIHYGGLWGGRGLSHLSIF